MLNRLSRELESNQLISHAHYGYGKGSGTEPAVSDLTHDIRKALDRKLFCATVFNDVSKANQAVNHDILLAQAEKYGIRGFANNLLSNFLKGRKQLVKVGDEFGDFLSLELGAP